MKPIFLLLFFNSTFSLFSQDNCIFVIGRIVEIRHDYAASKAQRIEDSLNFCRGVWRADTLENGTIISKGPVQIMRMSNPYILTVEVQKSYSNSLLPKSIDVRIWEHENPELYLNNEEPRAFLLAEKDSLEIYPTFDYFRVFKTVTGLWAEPVGTRSKVYPRAKKALFNYALLKELNSKYYQLISDKDLCIDEF